MPLVLTIVSIESLLGLCVVWWLLRSSATEDLDAIGARRPRGLASALGRRSVARLRRPFGGPIDVDSPRVLSRGQALFGLTLAVAIACGLAISALATLAAVNGLLIVFFMAAYGFKLVLIGSSLRSPTAVRPAAASAVTPTGDLPPYTILLPIYREAAVLPQLVKGIRGLSYPLELLDVKLLLEHDDLETQQAVAELDLPDSFEVLIVPDVGPAGKARACNHGLALARGEFLVIFDAEDCPEPDQLGAAVSAFGRLPSDVVCLQARLNCFNRDHSLLTRWFTAEYSVWFDQLLPGLETLNAPIPLGGTSNHFVTERLRELGGWDVYNVTEDAELGIRIFMHGWTTAVIDATTYEEATSRYGNWVRQRSRWVKGYMQTYLRYMRHPIEAWRRMGTLGFAVFQLFFGANTLCLLLNPIYWALVAVWFAWRPIWLEEVFPAPVFYVALIGLLIGNAACVIAMISGCYGRRNYADVKWAFLAPIYWLLMSFAAYKALIQLVYKPWYWEKTDHGFCALPDTPLALLPVAERGLGSRALAGGAPATPSSAAQRDRRARRTRELGILVRGRLAVPLRHELASVAAVATIASVSATLWSAATHSLVLYGDAAAHLDVARRVTDGLSEGLAQLGSVWLPLPHMLLVPFVAITALWHSGIAGALVSGACFVYTAVRIYSLVYELSASRRAAWCAFAVAVLNLNVLYVQTTALTEPVLIAFIVGAVFHLARWMRTFSMAELLWAAALTVGATLSRYEGWGLLAAEVVAVVLWGRLADRRRNSPQANTLVFLLVGAYGIALWFLYNLVIFGDPLYFLDSVYSAEKINGGQAAYGLLGTKGHLGTTLLTFGWDLVEVVGPVVLVASAVAVVLAFVPSPQRRRQLVVLGLLAAPVLFDLVSLFAGQITIRVPEVAPHQLWNDRYALIALPLCASAIGFAAARSRISTTVAAGAIAAGLALMSFGTPITLADGRHGISSANDGHPLVAAVYLRHHYRGGRILADDLSGSSVMFESGLDLDQFISPGFRRFWGRALASPATQARWVLAYPGDAVADDMAAHPRRFAAFRLVVVANNGGRLLERRSMPETLARTAAHRTRISASVSSDDGGPSVALSAGRRTRSR